VEVWRGKLIRREDRPRAPISQWLKQFVCTQQSKCFWSTWHFRRMPSSVHAIPTALIFSEVILSLQNINHLTNVIFVSKGTLFIAWKQDRHISTMHTAKLCFTWFSYLSKSCRHRRGTVSETEAMIKCPPSDSTSKQWRVLFYRLLEIMNFERGSCRHWHSNLTKIC
jgi:hypothetical protein